MLKVVTLAFLHSFLVHDTRELQLAFSNLYYFLDEPGTNRVLEFGDSEAWSVIVETSRE